MQPVQSVKVGSFVSGPLRKVCVDFNDKVKKDQLLAKIDPLLSIAQVCQGSGFAGVREGQFVAGPGQVGTGANMTGSVHRACCRQGYRGHRLRLGQGNYETAKANVAVCKATIKQNEASLELAKTNLAYCEIKSPVDGIVTDRKVDPGQTLASQFQTPEMFMVAAGSGKESLRAGVRQ